MRKIVSLITPFKNDKEVDYKKLDKLIRYQISSGMDEIILCSTTGDGNTLSFNEKKDIVLHVLSKYKDKIGIILSINERCLDEAIALLNITSEINKVIVSTEFIDTNTEGLYNYIQSILNYSKVPVILEIDEEVDQRVYIKSLYHTSLEGIVFTYINEEMIVKISSNFPLAKLYLNNDVLLEDFSRFNGVISTFANLYPKRYIEILNNISEYKRWEYLIEVLSLEPNPIMIKEAMNLIGLEVGPFRFPYYHPSMRKKELLIKALVSVI